MKPKLLFILIALLLVAACNDDTADTGPCPDIIEIALLGADSSDLLAVLPVPDSVINYYQLGGIRSLSVSNEFGTCGLGARSYRKVQLMHMTTTACLDGIRDFYLRVGADTDTFTIAMRTEVTESGESVKYIDSLMFNGQLVTRNLLSPCIGYVCVRK